MRRLVKMERKLNTWDSLHKSHKILTGDGPSQQPPISKPQSSDKLAVDYYTPVAGSLERGLAAPPCDPQVHRGSRGNRRNNISQRLSVQIFVNSSIVTYDAF